MSSINLFQPFTIRGVTLKNRIVVSPLPAARFWLDFAS
jgi:2,4-dienoyl-CoA reductase-like NADH-dependent reductase (Old Yellow Enzyme family)